MAVTAAIVPAFSGCVGYGPVVIDTQPADTAVPLGSAATFSVVVTSTTALSYQWQQSGADIPGATSATYTTPIVSIADSGTTYDVVVKGRFDSAVSRSAVLTVGPRYPAVGDLRFQQVDAATTVNGYPAIASTDLGLGGGGASWTNAAGIPLVVGPSCDPSFPSPLACLWFVDAYSPAAGSPHLSAYYETFFYSDLASTLATLGSTSVVITGMDLEPVNLTTAFSWEQQASGAAFDGSMQTVAPTSIQSAVAAEGLKGRVVTAVSYNNGNISYMSYGWQGNGSTVYESEVLTAPFANTADVASTMAAQGYILTAIGGNEYTGVILVGTRVAGDSLPRPIMVIPAGSAPYPLADQGYAVVAVLFSSTTGFAWIGER